MLIALAVVCVAGGAFYLVAPNAIDHYARAVEFHAAGDFPAAIVELKNVLRDDAGHPEARRLLGEAYLALGRGAEAEKELSRARELGVMDPKMLPMLARSLLMQGKYEQALKDIREWSVSSDDPDWRVLFGEASLGLRNMEQASKAFADALDREPDNQEAKRGLAIAGMAKSDSSAARRAVEHAFKDAKVDIATWILKGELEIVQREFVEAEGSFSKGLELVPGNKLAREGLVRALLGQNRTDDAIPHVQALVARFPKDPMIAHLRALVAFQKEDLNAAKEALRVVLEMDPAHPSSLLLLGEVHYLQRDLQQAADVLGRFVKQEPENLRGRKLLASVLLDLERPADAVEVLDYIEARARSDAQFDSLLATAYTKLGVADKALEHRERARALQGGEGHIAAQAALEHLKLGAADEALQELEAATREQPELTGAAIPLALSYLKEGRLDEALATARRLVEEQPNDPEVRTLLGVVQEVTGEIESAAQGYRHALELDPHYHPAALNLARMELKSGKRAEAVARIRAVLERDRNHPTALTWLAMIASQEGRAEESLDLLERARTANPDAYQPRMILAGYYLGRGEGERALEVAQELEKVAPGNPAVMYLVARGRLATGDVEGAIKGLEALAARHPGSADVHLHLALAHERRGDVPSMRASLQQALHLDPEHLRAQVKLGILERRAGNFREALRIAGALKLAHPDTSAGFLLEGDVFLAQGDAAQAALAYQRAHERAPDPATLTRMYRARYRVGDVEGAEASMSTWLGEHPADVVARFERAETLEAHGDPAEAAREYEQVLTSHPDNVSALVRLAWLYHQLGDPRDLRMAEQAHERGSENPFVVDAYGWMLVEAGLIQRGTEVLARAVEMAPTNPDIRYHYAAALAKSGEVRRAEQILTALVNSNEEFRLRPGAQALLLELLRTLTQ